MKKSGFTLVELVVTLIVVAILAATFAPRLASESINVGALAEQLAGDIRYVQSLSMTEGKRHCINLTAPSTSYSLTTDLLLAACPTAVTHPATGSSTVQLISGASITSVTNLPNGFAAFNGKGIPYTDAATTLAADAVITLTIGPDSRTVSISTQTGRVIVQ